MRQGAINAEAINTDPMNGSGVYPILQALSISWNAVAQVPARLLSIAYDVNSGGSVIGALVVSWDVREFIARTQALSFDVRQFVNQQAFARWDVRAFIAKMVSIQWGVLFATRPGSIVSPHSAASRLTRHTEFSPISKD